MGGPRPTHPASPHTSMSIKRLNTNPKAGVKTSQAMLLKNKTGLRWEGTFKGCISPYPERTRAHQ